MPDMTSVGIKKRPWRPHDVLITSWKKPNDATDAATVITTARVKPFKTGRPLGRPFLQCLGHADFCRNSLRCKRLDHISALHIVVIADGNTALHAVAYLAGIVLEALEG